MRSTLRKMLLTAAGSTLFISGLKAQVLPAFYSVERVGANTIDEALYLKKDAAGNMYSSGRFAGTVSFGGVPLTASTAANNYVAKQDSNGNFLWAAALPRVSTTPAETFRTYLAVDPKGRAYTTAIFNNTVTIGGNTFIGGTGSDYSLFIAKQATDGSFSWAIKVKDPSVPATIAAGPICSDTAGNVYISGKFSGTIDFDPGPGTANMTATATNAMFILKLDSSGNYVWARAVNSAGNAANLATPLAMAADAGGNIYTMGYFSVVDINAAEYVDFDPGPGSANLKPGGPNNIGYFISKLSTAGDHIWSVAYGNSASTPNPKNIAMTLSNDGNLYTSGIFDGTADFDPGPGTTTLTAVAGDAFLTRLDTAGSYIWTKQITGPGVESISAIALDSTGNIYTTGYFDQTADFDPGPGAASRTSTNTNTAAFVCKWDNQGNYIDAVNTENVSTATSRGCGLAVNNSGTRVYAAGTFNTTVDFNPGAASNTATAAGSFDMFFLMLAPPVPLPVTLSAFNAYAEGSNARLNWTTASEEGNKGFEIQRSTDGSNWQRIGYVSSLAERGNSSQELDYEFTDHTPATGINYYRLKQENVDGKANFSQVRVVSFSRDNTISIYPNPAKDMLYLSGMNGGETVMLYNTAGLLLKTGKINNAGTSAFSLHGQPAGLYYLKIMTQTETRTFKLTVDSN